MLDGMKNLGLATPHFLALQNTYRESWTRIQLQARGGKGRKVAGGRDWLFQSRKGRVHDLGGPWGERHGGTADSCSCYAFQGGASK